MRPAAGLLLLIGAATAAHAGFPAGFLEATPAAQVTEAMDAPYGKLLVAEAARIIELSADQACLKSKGLTHEAMLTQTREMFIRNGIAMSEMLQDMIDAGKFQAAFEKQLGTGATAEYVRLRADPQVRRLIELGRPARIARLADHITENVDRHAFLKRVPLKARLSAVAAGNLQLMEASPSDEAMHHYAAAHPTPAVKRWGEMAAAVPAAWKESLDHDAFARSGPAQMTPTVVTDLANLCVARP